MLASANIAPTTTSGAPESAPPCQPAHSASAPATNQSHPGARMYASVKTAMSTATIQYVSMGFSSSLGPRTPARMKPARRMRRSFIVGAAPPCNNAITHRSSPMAHDHRSIALSVPLRDPAAGKKPRSEWRAVGMLLPYLWEFRVRVLIAMVS